MNKKTMTLDLKMANRVCRRKLTKFVNIGTTIIQPL